MTFLKRNVLSQVVTNAVSYCDAHLLLTHAMLTGVIFLLSGT